MNNLITVNEINFRREFVLRFCHVFDFSFEVFAPFLTVTKILNRSTSNTLKLKIEYGYTKRVMKDGYTVLGRKKNKKFKDYLLNCRWDKSWKMRWIKALKYILPSMIAFLCSSFIKIFRLFIDAFFVSFLFIWPHH